MHWKEYVVRGAGDGTNLWLDMSNVLGEKKQAALDDDIELVGLCQKGELSAFEALVEKHQRKMLNIAYRMIGDYEAACEVVQDAFLSAYKSIKKFRGEAKFSTWLCRIVINLSKNRMKQMKTRWQREGASIDDPVETEEGQIRRDPPSPEPSVLEQMEKKEVQAKVQACINSLEGEYREVLILRDIQGFTYDEIRDTLNIPDGTVKSRLFRARDTLKDRLKDVFGDL
jgi:RNA polymerase sigma-70 factor (ECF subfamily)